MVGVKKYLRKVKGIKTWQLALLLIPLAFLAATLLRFNHLKMVEYKKAVVAADEEGNVDKITTALNDLKTYTESHTVINVEEKNGLLDLSFGSGEIYLKNSYERDTTALRIQAQENAGVYANPNGNIYEQAMSVCQPLAHQNGWDWNTPEYIACYQTELAKYPTADAITDITVDLPSTSLYRYDFVSPIIAPRFTNFVIFLWLVLALYVVVKAIFYLVARLAVRFLKM